MASRFLVRRRRHLVDLLNVHLRCIHSFQNSNSGQSTRHFDLQNSSTGYVSPKTKIVNEGDIFPIPCVKSHVTDFSALGVYRSTYFILPTYQYRGQKNRLATATALDFQSSRYASTATAGQPEYDDEEYESVAAKKRKEASPEECDQAVVGLSTAKAKVKAKLQDSQKGAQTVLHKVWASLLGIGPALRAVASMSRLVSCRGDWTIFSFIAMVTKCSFMSYDS